VRPPAWAGADQRAGARGAAVPRLAVLVAVVAGLLNFVSVLLPAERARLALLSRWVPGMVSRGATVATASASNAMTDMSIASPTLKRFRRSLTASTVSFHGAA